MARNCRQLLGTAELPVGPEGGFHLRAGKKLGSSVTHCKVMNSVHGLKELGRGFFPTLVSR